MTHSNKGIFSSSFGYAVSKNQRTQEIDLAGREIAMHDALIEAVKNGEDLPPAPGFDMWDKLNAVCSSKAVAEAFDMNALDVVALCFLGFMADDDLGTFNVPQWAIDGATVGYYAAKLEASRPMNYKRTSEGEQVVAYADAVWARLEATPSYYSSDLKGLKAYRSKKVTVRSRAAKAIKDGRAK